MQVSSCFAWQKKDWVPMWLWRVVAEKYLRERPVISDVYVPPSSFHRYTGSPSWKE